MVICSMKDEDGSIWSAGFSILVSHFCYVVYWILVVLLGFRLQIWYVLVENYKYLASEWRSNI